MVRLGQNKNSLIKSFDIHLKSDRVSLGTSGIDSFQGLLDFSIDRIFGRRNNNIEESFQMIILINNIIADKILLNIHLEQMKRISLVLIMNRLLIAIINILILKVGEFVQELLQ